MLRSVCHYDYDGPLKITTYHVMWHGYHHAIKLLLLQLLWFFATIIMCSAYNKLSLEINCTAEPFLVVGTTGCSITPSLGVSVDVALSLDCAGAGAGIDDFLAGVSSTSGNGTEMSLSCWSSFADSKSASSADGRSIVDKGDIAINVSANDGDDYGWGTRWWHNATWIKVSANVWRRLRVMVVEGTSSATNVAATAS